MSIYSAMRAGVTGLNANASAMAAISDNIANLNTVGYKATETSFDALVNSQNVGTTYNAGGVLAATTRAISQHGSLNQTTSSTDLAINGSGFFIVTNDPNASAGTSGGLFTRAGSFTTDANGLLKNTDGLYLLGVPITSGSTATVSSSSLAALQPISLANVGSQAVASTTTSINANLNSSEDIYSGTPSYTAGSMADGTVAPQVERSVEIYDSLGTARTMTLGFIKTGVNTWAAEVYMRPATDSANASGLVASGNITFSSSGVPTSVDSSLTNFTINYAAATGAAAQPMTLDLSTALTQFAAASTLNSATTDGSPPGTLSGVSISEDGILTAKFSNGRSQALYVVPVATFLNPDGLEATDGGAFRQTLASGQYTISQPGAGGAGSIKSNALEASNVDLGTEFTNLITTQRAYSAASKIITTADDMLQELIQIKR